MFRTIFFQGAQSYLFGGIQWLPNVAIGIKKVLDAQIAKMILNDLIK